VARRIRSCYFATKGRRRVNGQLASVEDLPRIRAFLERHVDLILFTGQHNVAARALYESQGFEEIGEFGMMLGVRS
jgi:ribosomal protein S18 acetylase RimI-like enzyme